MSEFRSQSVMDRTWVIEIAANECLNLEVQRTKLGCGGCVNMRGGIKSHNLLEGSMLAGVTRGDGEIFAFQF